MEYKSNVKEVQARLALLRANIAAGVFSDACAAGLRAGMEVMRRRIFNQSLAADGSSLGDYISKPYIRRRQKKGRQVAKKDLQVDGTLHDSIEVVTVNNNRAEVRITDDADADIARWQEQQIFNIRNGRPANEASGGKVPIFEFNELERDIASTTTRELIKQKLNF